MTLRSLMMALAVAATCLFASGCASSLKDVKIDKVQLCDKGQCATLGQDIDNDTFLSKTYSFLSGRINQDGALAEVDPVTKEVSGSGIKYFTQGGPLPFYCSINSLKYTDVSYLDREKREIRFKLRPWSFFLGVPVLCAEGEGTLTVNSAVDVSMEVSNLCTWMVVGTSSWQMRLKLDKVDLDSGSLSGYYSAGHAGPMTVGKGSGYLSTKFGPPSGAVLPVAASAVATVSTAAIVKNGGSDLSYNLTFSDANKDGVLDPGERISLTLDVTNRGNAAAKNLRVVLGGTPYLVKLLGEKKELESIQPQETRRLIFEGVLPGRLPADQAELRIDLREAGAAPSETRTLILASRTGKSIETVQIISQPPRLQFTLELKDQNNNRILEGGEEITLVAQVANRGEGLAENVQLVLSGSQILVTLFGAKQPVGNLAPGSSKWIEMKGVLPANVSSESAELKIELSEGRGFAPSESRVLRVATRRVETSEVVEVISDLSVDDIPAKVRDYVRKDDVAVVIGIGSYRESTIPAVKYARRDAEVVAKYLEHLSGIPKANIALLTDANATKSDIEAHLEDWLPRRVTSNSRVYVYYAGHGTPEPGGKNAYLVPYDGHPDFTSKLLPLGRVQEALNRLQAREIVVLLDSCFSGASGRSVMQSGIRPLVMTNERQLAVGEKSVVVASASGSEVTSDFEQARHGLFTYYLLKGLRGEADRNADSRVTLGELFGFVSSNVTRTASRDLNRNQTPVLLEPAGNSGFSGLEIARTR